VSDPVEKSDSPSGEWEEEFEEESDNESNKECEMDREPARLLEADFFFSSLIASCLRRRHGKS